SLRQGNSADFSFDLVFLPARAAQVASHDALDGQRPRLAYQHGTSSQLPGKRVEGGWKLCRAQNVIWNDIPQKIEPEKRKLREHLSFVRNRGRHDHIERGKAVGGDNEKLVAKIEDVAHFPASRGRDAGKI